MDLTIASFDAISEVNMVSKTRKLIYKGYYLKAIHGADVIYKKNYLIYTNSYCYIKYIKIKVMYLNRQRKNIMFSFLNCCM